MRHLLAALAAACLALPVTAGDLVIKNDAGAELRLYDSACSHAGTLALLKEEWRVKFKNARIIDGGRISFYGCWIADDETAVIILEDGAATALPLSAFSDPSI